MRRRPTCATTSVSESKAGINSRCHVLSLQRPLSVHLAVELATLYHSRLTLLHVVSEEHTAEEQCQRLRKQAQDELAALIAERGDVQIAANVRIRGGNPPERIIAFGCKVQAELIILGASAASRTSHFLGELSIGCLLKHVHLL